VGYRGEYEPSDAVNLPLRKLLCVGLLVEDLDGLALVISRFRRTWVIPDAEKVRSLMSNTR
jgi:hypothetical protein